MPAQDLGPRRYQRPPDEPAGGHCIVTSGSRSWLKVDDHRLPYIELTEIDPEQLRADYGLDKVAWADPNIERYARRLRQAIEEGEPCYYATIDDRFCSCPLPESEVNRWGWFLANAMAVSAGYTSHGKNSRPINRHGPSRT